MKPESAIPGRRGMTVWTSSARFDMEYASGEDGPVEEPQPRKSTAKIGPIDVSNGIILEKVREEPPQKCRKMRAGLDSVLGRDFDGRMLCTLTVVEGAMVCSIVVVMVVMLLVAGLFL
jgi:hypothetical protein